MRMETRYIAFDEMEFDNAKDCEKYEIINAEKTKCIKSVSFFDENGKKISFDDVSSGNFIGVWKVIINNFDQYNAFRILSEALYWIGTDDITSEGTWKYIEEAERFIRIDDIIRESVTQIKWERDEAMHMLNNMNIPFCHVHKDITDNVKNEKISLADFYDLIDNGDVRIIQIGGFGK